MKKPAELRGRRLTQGVDHADSTHVELQEGVVDGLPSLVVHEEVVDHRAELGRQASQEVHHAQPGDADLRPGDVERQQHQEADQRDSWRGEGKETRQVIRVGLILDVIKYPPHTVHTFM